MENEGSWFWSFAVVAGPVILGLALAWVLVAQRRRSRSRETECRRDEATREIYRGER